MEICQLNFATGLQKSCSTFVSNKKGKVMNEILHLMNEMSPYLLLGFLLAGLMHAFIPGRFYTKYLADDSFGSVLRAALFGIPLPLCSCGVIPTAMSIRKEGASKGAVTSFLISTPQTGVDSIIATYSLMGWAFAIIRPIAALVTAIFGGSMVNIFAKEKAEHTHSEEHAHEASHACCHEESCGCGTHSQEDSSFGGKIKEALVYAFQEMMEDIGKWLMIGLIVAGLITVFVPDEAFAVFKGNTFASMLLVICIAIPMYLCATGSIPIAVALILKGLTPGAGLVLLMAGPACNMASILVVRKVLGTRTLVTYLASIIVGSICCGIFIDYLQFHGIVDFLSNLVGSAALHEEGDSWFSWTCTAVLILLLINALVLPKLGIGHHHAHCCCGEEGHCDHEKAHSSNHSHYHIKGMTCNHCREAAEKALRAVEGVVSVTVDLASGEAHIEGDAKTEDLRRALEEIGFALHEEEAI